jgi:hypothetical protein
MTGPSTTNPTALDTLLGRLSPAENKISATVVGGTPQDVTSIVCPPGCDVSSGVLHFFRGNGGEPVTVDTSGAVTIFTQAFAGLTASRRLYVVLGCRVILDKTSSPESQGHIEIVVGATITTNAGGTSTSVVLASVPNPDLTKLPTGLAGTTANLVAATGGFTLTVTKPTGVASLSARGEWTSQGIYDLGAA